jgi:DNA-binding CsgD family transcriptional regulator
VHYSPKFPKNYRQVYDCFVRKVEIPGPDSVIYLGGFADSSFYFEIPFRYNRLHIEFSANDFENPQNLVFSTYLDGFDREWTAWQNHSIREFTNLRHGDYTFKVKARNIFGIESSVGSLSFYVGAPWYLSWFAYVMYFIAFVLVVFLLARYVRYRMEKSKRQEEERQKRLFRDREKQLQTDALRAEKEVIRLRNDKLRAEMKLKDKELANSTMQMIQQSKSLTGIKKGLNKLSREIGDELISNYINSMVRKIDREIDSEMQWEVFEKHFESVHEEFLKRLKATYPDLTPRELKLCAYLRLNISSKEIATLMNISTRGVEISRYRLRKKLLLEHDTNLTDFIVSF